VSATGGSVALSSYEFSLNQNNWQRANLFSNLSSGFYTVFVRDNNGCLSTDTIRVEDAEPFYIMNFVSDTTFEYGDTIQLFSVLNDTSGVEIEWLHVNNLSILDTVNYTVPISPFEQVVYRFTAVSPIGCVVDSTVTIRVAKPRKVGAAQAFTPNNDGHNDWFFIQGDDRAVKINTFRIYDRWGELVYEGLDLDLNDPEQGWNGTFKGEKLTSGVYAWYAEISFIDGEVIVIRGDVTLIR
jgi:gliding motility-associated-like protein